MSKRPRMPVWTILLGLLAAMLLHIAIGIVGRIHSFAYAMTGLAIGFMLFVTVTTALVMGRLRQRRPRQSQGILSAAEPASD